jgi:hypothetical protein
MKRSCLLCFPLSILVGCSAPPEHDGDPVIGGGVQSIAGATAAGVIPSGLPARMMVGLFEDTGQSWMRNSGVAWDVRYRYFTKGWVNNWGWGAYDGSWGLGYMQECDQQGFIPAIQYYQVFGEPGGGEQATLQKIGNATTMRSYFGDFKILMQRAKDFGKPVLVLLEADALGFLQQQSGSNPNASAAIASTGMPELAGLPNTVAGWGLAFLQIKKAVGANNAFLGVHLSAWASGKDVAHFNVTEPLQPEVDKVYNFLAPAGLGSNVTGTQYDVLVGDPLDRDADYYRLVQGQDRWWNASDSAPISSRSFNRYAEWLRLWNVKSQKRWVLWQIPLGNSNHKNVFNNGGSAEGYKDNRPEYFFGNGTAHISKFGDVGAIALLFGAGTGGMSSYGNDTYTDGQLFMKSRAGAILNAGGVPLADGRGGGPTCSPVAGAGTGLRGEYFSGKTLSTSLLVRTDATVNFDWGSGSPAATVPSNDFSARWTGQVSPRFTGPVTFYTRSDDGVRLWINNQLLVDNWTDHGPTENSGSITLTAGQRYDLKLEYYEAGGGAVAQLSWSSTCETKQAIPAAQLFPAAGGTQPPPADPAIYNFEASAQSWTTNGGMLTGVASSTDRAFAGVRSLKVSFAGSASTQHAFVANPATPAGRLVTFRIWLPSGAPITAIQPFVLQGAAGGWTWTGSYRAIGSLAANQWNTITVQVPAAAVTPLAQLGVEFTTNGSYTGAAYIDAVSW